MYYTRFHTREICITRDLIRGRYVLHAISCKGDMYYTRAHARVICITRDLIQGRYELHAISYKGDMNYTRSRIGGYMYYTRFHASEICITRDHMWWRYVLHAIVCEGDKYYTRSRASKICITRDLIRGEICITRDLVWGRYNTHDLNQWRYHARDIFIKCDSVRWCYVLHAIFCGGDMFTLDIMRWGYVYARSYMREICITCDNLLFEGDARWLVLLYQTIKSCVNIDRTQCAAVNRQVTITYTDDSHQVIRSPKHYILPSLNKCHFCLNEAWRIHEQGPM